MGQMLASDAANPEFMGAHNPDSRLAVQFYSKPIENEFETKQQGRPVFVDTDMVKIFTPGDNLNIVDTFAREDHKKRFPLQWAHYQNKHGGDSRQIGTPLSQWPLLSAARVEELKALKFFTVDQIANASDSQLQSLGMVAGMSPYAFRDRAQQFLRVAGDESAVSKSEERIKALEAENARIQSETAQKLAEMQEQMQNILAAVGEKKKPGRKPNAEKGAE